MTEPSFQIDFPVDLKDIPPPIMNVMLRALEEMPYKLSRPVMDFIHQQVLAQALKRSQGGQVADQPRIEEG